MTKEKKEIGFIDVMWAGLAVAAQHIGMVLFVGLGIHSLIQAAILASSVYVTLALAQFTLVIMIADVIDSRARIKLTTLEYNMLVDKSNDLVETLQRKIGILEGKLQRKEPTIE